LNGKDAKAQRVMLADGVMKTKAIKSQTAEFPTDRDVVAALLDQLIEKDGADEWVHIELVKRQDWLRHVLSQGYRPIVEILLNKDRTLRVNASELDPKYLTAVWLKTNRLWEVQMADRERLLDWIVERSDVASKEGFYLMGWLQDT
jgi:hypothetical protein